MKRYHTLVMALVLPFLSIYSQWGIKGGLDMSTIADLHASKYKLGFNIGGTYSIKLSEKWYLQPELLFSTSGCSLKKGESEFTSKQITMYGFELPLNLSNRLYINEKTRLIIDYGGYLKYNLFGNKTYSYKYMDNADPSLFDSFRRFDAGLALGLGVSVSQYTTMISYQRSITHASKDGYANYQKIRLSIAYAF